LALISVASGSGWSERRAQALDLLRPGENSFFLQNESGSPLLSRTGRRSTGGWLLLRRASDGVSHGTLRDRRRSRQDGRGRFATAAVSGSYQARAAAWAFYIRNTDRRGQPILVAEAACGLKRI
jgi:hypothetical protein